MSEIMEIEAAAVRASGAEQAKAYLEAQPELNAVADFEKAMEAPIADPVPFASHVNAVWRSAQGSHQANLRRIVTSMASLEGNRISTGQMARLQFDLMNLGFQQEVVSCVAKKASAAVETLVKNG